MQSNYSVGNKQYAFRFLELNNFFDDNNELNNTQAINDANNKLSSLDYDTNIKT